MKTDVFDLTGKKTGTLTLPASTFGVKVKPALLAQTVKAFLSNQRQGTKATKSRGQVTGSGKKVWRQKGTGRARHGDRYAPIFVGGGVAHGPTGQENYHHRLPAKIRRQALLAALSQKAAAKHIVVISTLATLKPKTKLLAKLLHQTANFTPSTKLVLILDQPVKPVDLAIKNLSGATRILAQNLNAYTVLQADRLVFTRDSLKLVTRKPL